MRNLPIRFLSPLFSFFLLTLSAAADRDESPNTRNRATWTVLSLEEMQEVENAVDNALAYLQQNQDRTGKFATLNIAQPGVTGLCILAFLARGHMPGEGPYGKCLEKAVRFSLSCQQKGGLIAYVPPTMRMMAHNAAHTAIYNHAIGGLALGEVYGMTGKDLSPQIRTSIQQALQFTRGLQVSPKEYAVDYGGWRYLQKWPGSGSDLSITAWQLLFLRSAKNAGFEIPSEYIDEAMNYVQRCFNDQDRAFHYGLIGEDRRTTRAMAGAGILSLSLGGLHNTRIARTAGDWLLRHPFEPYLGNAGQAHDTRYFYGAYYCTQAMYQLGETYWRRFYPRLARVLTANQASNGSWDAEPGEDNHYGSVYTTALAALALSTPYQLLPIYQR